MRNDYSVIKLFIFHIELFSIASCKVIPLNQSLLTKSRSKHSLEMEAQPHHMTFMPHHIDFSLNCDTMA